MEIYKLLDEFLYKYWGYILKGYALNKLGGAITRFFVVFHVSCHERPPSSLFWSENYFNLKFVLVVLQHGARVVKMANLILTNQITR